MRLWSPAQVAEEWRERRAALVIVDSSVYDVADMLANHPGGRQLLEAHCGQDVTQLFRGTAVGGHAHSDIATRVLLALRVGRCAQPSSRARRSRGCAAPAEAEERVNRPQEDSCESLERACGVDASRALVPQVGRLGVRYHEWLGWPSLSSEPLLMFDSWFLELVSKTPPMAVPLIWLPLVLHSLRLAAVGHAVPPLSLLAHCLLGLLAWASVEYLLHRFVFHARPVRAWAITLHFSLHGCHHKRPKDHLRLVFPPLFAAPVVAFFWRVCGAVAGEAGRGAALFGGMLLGYVTYDCTHYLTHSSAASVWLAHIRDAHLAHHFVDPTRGFGVSSDLVDRLCGTRPLSFPRTKKRL